MTRLGIDVASWQHPGGAPIDWTKVKGAGVDWCAVKATEGTFYTNPYAADDVLCARRAGLEVVVYHFARPMQSTARQQARYLRAWMEDHGAGLPIALDVEDGRQMGWKRLADWCAEFVLVTEATFLYWPRSYRDGLRGAGLRTNAAEWLAAPGALKPGEVCAVQQYDQQPMAGILAPVDVNHVFYPRAGAGLPAPVAPHSGRPVDPDTAPTLRLHSRGEAVTILQESLRRAGLGIPTDGVFGPVTLNAVKAFQRSHALAADGVVGPKTWRALMSAIGH